MIYHHIALNTILPPLTYAYPEKIPVGTRVLVSLRNQIQVGIVWASDVSSDLSPEKILVIQMVFADEPPLPPNWRELMAFTARYYHYPIGQTVFTALPHHFKEKKPLTLPQIPVFYQLNELGKTQNPPLKNHAKKRLLWENLATGFHTLSALKKIHPNAQDFVLEWEKSNWIEKKTASLPPILPSDFILNDEQKYASQRIQSGLNEFQAFVLYGITGSGKTEVYFDVMAKVLAQGKQVLFLLPEIHLTPQLLKRIERRFPEMPLAVLHSQTATGKRGQDYLRAQLNHAKLIVGTRLAVFTPLADLGLIVVDEEHDHSFKQDNELRYHARDLAIWRAKQASCPIILGSATPSLETWQKTETGAFSLLSLTQRARETATLPDIHILDVRKIRLEQGLSPQVLDLLKKNHQKGKMSLVYLNRRGFAPALFCADCGHTFGCPNCSAKLVLHQRVGQMRCHHCDFRQVIARECPQCGNQDLTAIGQGTQRIEETLKSYLPQAKIARVDRDSISHKNAWDDLYQKIQENHVDILVGTQMLAKGHDFARLNLVIVVNADGSLFSSDFRAPERLFAELMQVSGRAGRAEQGGQVLIQTQLPEHPIFSALQAQDFATFARYELAQRAMFHLPPLGFQAVIRADAVKLNDAVIFLNEIRDLLASMLPNSVFQMGAVPMNMMRLAERERAQIFLESVSRTDLHYAIDLWIQVLSQNTARQIRWSVDIDPQDM